MVLVYVFSLMSSIVTNQSIGIIVVAIICIIIILFTTVQTALFFGHYFKTSISWFSRLPSLIIFSDYFFRVVLVLCNVLIKNGWIVSSSSATTSTLAVYSSFVILHQFTLFIKVLFIVVSFIHFPIFHLLSHHQPINHSLSQSRDLHSLKWELPLELFGLQFS